MTSRLLRRQSWGLSPASVLSLSDAADMLGGRQADRVAWFRSEGLVFRLPPDGPERVIWADVLDRLRHAQPASEAPRGRALRLPRVRLPRAG